MMSHQFIEQFWANHLKNAFGKQYQIAVHEKTHPPNKEKYISSLHYHNCIIDVIKFVVKVLIAVIKLNTNYLYHLHRMQISSN